MHACARTYMCRCVSLCVCVCLCSHMQMSIGCHIKFNVLPARIAIALLLRCSLPFLALLFSSSLAASLVNACFDVWHHQPLMRVQAINRWELKFYYAIWRYLWRVYVMRNTRTLRIRQVHSLSLIIIGSNKHLNANAPSPPPLVAAINS